MVPSPKSKGGMRASSWVGFHTFRHTCATSLIVDEDWRLEQVQVYLGHKDINSTLVYLTITQDLLQQASERFRVRGARVLQASNQGGNA